MIRIATMQNMKEIASPMKMYGKLLVTNASKRDPIVSGRIKTTPRRMRLSEMIELRLISFPNVPSDLSLLAFGIPPAREAESAGGMPKVPKGQGLGRLACSAYSCSELLRVVGVMPVHIAVRTLPGESCLQWLTTVRAWSRRSDCIRTTRM